MKLITFAVPCYNSAAYMEKCVETLLTAGPEAEIILIDDGSTQDDTPAICDRYQAQYPDIVRAIHQPNGGHGEGVNQGLRHAAGKYYKVVDSDDWLDPAALETMLAKLRTLADQDLDMLVCNYVYEHNADGTSYTMHYKNVFPQDRIFSWEDCGRFRPNQYLLMHSVVYRTELLRECGLELPKHTFYVDNIFVYYPLPKVKRIYYMDLDLYRYFIGREDQSVNEAVMVRRVDQQIAVTELMFDYYNIMDLKKTQPRLARYMFRYLSMMLTICSTLLNLDGSPEALEKKRRLWSDILRKHPELRQRLRRFSLAAISNLPGRAGRKAEVTGYRFANRIFKFN
jgi:glycosyltransferase involved in cell wall biosynthesis